MVILWVSRTVLFVFVFFVLQTAIQGQKVTRECEYPTFGYFRVLDGNLKPVPGFYELVLDYKGSDITDEMHRPMTVALIGNLAILKGEIPQYPPKPDLDIAGTPVVPINIDRLEFTRAKLTVGPSCVNTFSAMTSANEGRSYKLDGVVLDKYREENGARYRMTGTLTIFQGKTKLSTTGIKLVRHRE